MAILVAQTVVAGWGHTHTHSSFASTHAAHGVGHVHRHAANDHFDHEYHDGSQPGSHQSHLPVDKDDCSICRHLALAGVLTLELTSLPSEDAVETVPAGSTILITRLATGEYRPRAPPQMA